MAAAATDDECGDVNKCQKIANDGGDDHSRGIGKRDAERGVVFPIRNLRNLTAPEVMEELRSQFKDCVVDSVDITKNYCYVGTSHDKTHGILRNADFKIRGNVVVSLEDVDESSIVLQLRDIPAYIRNDQIAEEISRFADVIGDVAKDERGDRFVRVKTPEVIPNQILIDSTPVTVKIEGESDYESISKRKSFRSKLDVCLKRSEIEMDGPDTSRPTGGSPSTTASKWNSPPLESNGNAFHFPTTTPSSAAAATPNSSRVAVPTGKKIIISRSRGGNGVSPKILRKMSVNFKGDEGTTAAAPGVPTETWSKANGSIAPENVPNNNSHHFFRDRSASDASSKFSICRRKLSATGHEDRKIPWCGCWGIGCC